MRAHVAVVVLFACGSPQPMQNTAPVPLPSSPVASASASHAPVADDPVARVQEAVSHMLELLVHGDDETFIDQAVVPEEIAKVLGDRTKQELVTSFKADKHDEVVKVLERVRKMAPTEVSHDGGRTLVKYDGGPDRDITFVVDGPHVYIHN